MDGIVIQHPDGHPSGHVHQHQTDDRHRDGHLNPKHIGQTQADGVGPKASQPDHQHGEERTEGQGLEAVGRRIGHPCRGQEGHPKEHQENDGAIVNVADEKVVALRRHRAFGAALLPFGQHQQFGVQRFERGGGLALIGIQQLVDPLSFFGKTSEAFFPRRHGSKAGPDIPLKRQIGADEDEQHHRSADHARGVFGLPGQSQAGQDPHRRKRGHQDRIVDPKSLKVHGQRNGAHDGQGPKVR